MMNREIDWEDEDGRKYRTILPQGVPDTEAHLGIPVGPPDLRPLELPQDVEIRLHNQLHARGIFTERQAKARVSEVFAALQAAFRVDTQKVIVLFREQGQEDS